MALSNIIRGIGHGVASVGRAVQAASQKLDQTVAGTPAPTAPAPAPAPIPNVTDKSGMAGTPGAQAEPVEGTPAPTAPAPSKGYSLPDIGPGPDVNAPEYQDEAGKKKYESDFADYEHKQDIHQAFADLDKIYSEAHPQRDFEKEYREQVSMQQEQEAARPRGSNLARAALALGEFNPAMQQSGRSNLAEYNKRIESEAAQSDKSFTQRMVLRQKMHESAAAEAEQTGNWKKALAESEKATLLKADSESLAHKREMAKTELQQEGATSRANIRRDAMESTAKIRARAVGAAHNLSGNFLKQFEKEAAKAVAKLLGPRDLTKEYSPADIDSITTYLEQLAEMFHDQEFGTEDGGANYFKTHPGKRAQPKVKERF